MADNQKVTVTEKAKKAHAKREGSKFWGLIFFLFKVVALPLYPVWNSVAKDRLKVVVHSHTNLIFLWPVPIAAAVLVYLSGTGVSAEWIGWMWVIVGLVSLLTVADKLNFAEGASIVAAFVILGLIAQVVELKYELPVISEVWKFISKNDVKGDVGTMRVAGILLVLLIGLYSVPRSVMVGRYRISSRRVDHRKVIFLESDGIVVDKSTPSLEIPNVFRFFLGFGAGSLVFKSGDHEVLRIDNIPGLWFVYPTIENIFDSQTMHIEQQ
jgi:hypothetical protein